MRKSFHSVPRLKGSHFLFFLFSSLLLTGCTTAGRQGDTQEAANGAVEDAWSLEFPEHYQYESDKLVMDFALDSPTSVPRCKVNAKTIDFSLYAEEFLNNVMPDMEYEYSENDASYDMDGNDTVYQSWTHTTPDHFSTILDTNGLELFCAVNPYNSMGDTRMNGSLRLYRDDAYSSYPENIHNNADVFLDKTFDFGSPEDAIASFSKTLASCGIETNGDFSYASYGMDAQTAEQEWYEEDTRGNPIDLPDFSGFAERYYILAAQSYKGLPVLYYANFPQLLDNPNSKVQMIFSASGLDEFSIDKMFTFEETTEQWNNLIDFQLAAETVQSLYENILVSSHYRVEKAGLYYYASRIGDGQEYELIPAWIFQVDEYTVFDQYIGTMPCIINAVTGLEMEYKK